MSTSIKMWCSQSRQIYTSCSWWSTSSIGCISWTCRNLVNGICSTIGCCCGCLGCTVATLISVIISWTWNDTGCSISCSSSSSCTISGSIVIWASITSSSISGIITRCSIGISITSSSIGISVTISTSISISRSTIIIITSSCILINDNRNWNRNWYYFWLSSIHIYTWICIRICASIHISV